ncbi:MAG: hypothetical protein ACREVJ_11205, partial [Gammaproteobacteria bacterium]
PWAGARYRRRGLRICGRTPRTMPPIEPSLPPHSGPRHRPIAPAPGGSELEWGHRLIVEDEPDIRRLMQNLVAARAKMAEPTEIFTTQTLA